MLHLAAHCQQLDCLKELHSKRSILEPSGLYLTQDKVHERLAWYREHAEYVLNFIYSHVLQKGWNILHYACAGGSVAVVQWLLQNVPELTAAEVLNQTSEVLAFKATLNGLAKTEFPCTTHFNTLE